MDNSNKADYNKENKIRMLRNLENLNSCSTSDQSWPLETFINPTPFSDMTNKVYTINQAQISNVQNIKPKTMPDNENSPPPHCYRAICPQCLSINWTLMRPVRPNESPKKLICRNCEADFCEKCRCSPFHRRTESCPSRFDRVSFSGKSLKKMR